MANIINVSEEQGYNSLKVVLRKCIQSANLNFLIGSGCSFPAIKPLGEIERKIQVLLEEGNVLEAEILKYLFLKPIAKSSTILAGHDYDRNTQRTIDNYESFIRNILCLLINRKNNILLKQANIFTTNYDFFIKKASETFGSSVKLNDGFNRNPKIDNQYIFSTSEFFTAVYNKGYLYNYQVEIPSINILKLHGSMSWKRCGERILFLVEDKLKTLRDDIRDTWNANDDQLLTYLKKFNDQFYIVLPMKDKLRDTLLNRIYYDLLRIYANELDKENTLLIAEGFSFEDEHILDITQRSLRNPTLRLIIFCYKKDILQNYKDKFNRNDNVDIIWKNEDIKFEDFNNIIAEVLPYITVAQTNPAVQKEDSNV